MKRKKCKEKKIRIVSPMGPSKTDPLGMYTGVPADRRERPVQDADDL